MPQVREIEEAVTWLQAAGRMAGIHVDWMVKRLRDGDTELSDAVHAVMEAYDDSWKRLESLKHFITAQLFDDRSIDEKPTIIERRRPSPFDVPREIIEDFARNGTKSYDRSLLTINQVYDSFEVGHDEAHAHASTHTSRLDQSGVIRLFGNANIGYIARTNLQVAGQVFGSMLLTSWWIETIPSDAMTKTLSHSYIRLYIGDKQRATTTGLSLMREPQPLLVKLPPRMNLAVEFGCTRFERPERTVPVFVHLEGWHMPEVW